MKYPPAPLTPFLASPPRIRRRTHILNEQRELKDHQPTLLPSTACRLLKSLASLFAPRILCFQRLAASFAKIPGGGYSAAFPRCLPSAPFEMGGSISARSCFQELTNPSSPLIDQHPPLFHTVINPFSRNFFRFTSIQNPRVSPTTTHYPPPFPVLS